MKKILKRRFLQANGYQMIAYTFLVVVITVCVFAQMSDLSKGIYNLDTMTEADLQDAQVKGTVWGIWDTFAEKKNGGTYDIIPYGEGSYIAMYLPKKYKEQAELLLDETWEYLDGNAAGIDDPFVVNGSLGAMESDEKKLFESYVNEYDEDLQELFLPYILRVDHIGNMSYFDIAGCSLIVLIFGILLFRILVKFFTKSYLKSIKIFCNQCEDKERAYRNFDQFIKRGTEYGNVYMNDELIFIPEPNFKVLTRDELLWIYPKRTNLKTYGATTGQRLELAFATKSGKTYLLNYPYNDNKLVDFISDVTKYFPEVMIGYTEELQKLFKTDRTAFAKKAYDESEERKNVFQNQKRQSEDQKVYTGPKQYIIHEKWYTVFLGILFALVGVAIGGYCLFMRESTKSDTMSLLMVGISVAVFGIILIVNFVNRRITVDYGVVTYQTIFGRRSTYQLSKLSCKFQVAGVGSGIIVYDENENKVFKYESNMVNSELLVNDLTMN